MIEIRLELHSPLKDILEFKTCCGLSLAEQNLEILVKNNGVEPVTMLSRLELTGPGQRLLLENLYPQPAQEIPPGQARAFYCQLSGDSLSGYHRAVMCDAAGRAYESPLGE